MLIPALGCAPIETQVTHSEHPRSGPILQLGEQLVEREYVADYVQLGPRVLVELHELRMCSDTRHIPVLRMEKVERTANNFIVWDFVLGGLAGGFAALAFAYPKPFSRRLYGSEGQLVYDQSPAWLVGGVFAGISAILLTAGIVNSIKARDEVRFAEAYRVDLAEQAPCSEGGERPAATTTVTLVLGEANTEALTIAGTTDDAGRVRFMLPPVWPAEQPEPAGPFVPAQLRLADEQVLTFELRVPWTEMIDAHTGRVDSRGGSGLGPGSHGDGREGPRAPDPIDVPPASGSNGAGDQSPRVPEPIDVPPDSGANGSEGPLAPEPIDMPPDPRSNGPESPRAPAPIDVQPASE
jgi:hypothetical protein